MGRCLLSGSAIKTAVILLVQNSALKRGDKMTAVYKDRLGLTMQLNAAGRA